ncbi:MAG: phosphonate metabolism protein/1,5-bisphosphokinase (PRPP-forming) PhnN [Alsobacter sp.]
MPETAPPAGLLVLVVGPSGAGKDTLIGLARAALADDPSVAFPRRLVTRPSSCWEEHDTLSSEAFEAGVRAGAWPLSWRAHGLGYALPTELADDLAQGRTIVANVSREAVAVARRRFPRVCVVYVTAPPDVLASRVAGRGRDADVSGRVSRVAPVEADLAPDLVIDNSGRAEEAAARLIGAIRGAVPA